MLQDPIVTGWSFVEHFVASSRFLGREMSSCPAVEEMDPVGKGGGVGGGQNRKENGSGRRLRHD